MKIYQIGGKIYAVIGEELYERMPDSNGREAFVETPSEAQIPARRKYGSGKLKQNKGTRRGSIHCKVCDGYHVGRLCLRHVFARSIGQIWPKPPNAVGIRKLVGFNEDGKGCRGAGGGQIVAYGRTLGGGRQHDLINGWRG
jgi:hypothetical protein